jgi:hypothetical protein
MGSEVTPKTSNTPAGANGGKLLFTCRYRNIANSEWYSIKTLVLIGVAARAIVAHLTTLRRRKNHGWIELTERSVGGEGRCNPSERRRLAPRLAP